MFDGKSTTGLGFNLGSGVMSLGSKKQEIVALSSTEAEYVATTTVACQIIWLRRILQDCGKEITKTTKLWVDNQSAIIVAKNPAHHGRT